MAALHSLCFLSPICSSPKLSSYPGGGILSSSGSFFNGGQPLRILPTIYKQNPVVYTTGFTIMMAKPTIQFIKGVDEQTVPDVKLTKSRDGTNGVAIFTFSEPSVFDKSSVLGDITGFYMIDDEGVLESVDVSARYVNGKPAAIEAKYIMRNPKAWDRFMRFMERYADANGLSFVKK